MDGFRAKDGKIYQNADGNFLRERNPIAFGFTNDSAGEAWRLTKSGKVYKDESIFGFKDYSWLNEKAEGGHTISGGEKFKTLISGLGIRVKEITGPCILVKNKNGAKWKDLRSCPENSEKTRQEVQVITRHLDVDLVPLVNQKATDDQLSYLGGTVCMAKLITNNNKIDNLSSLGFIFVIGTGFKNDNNKSLIGDQMKWNKDNKIVSAGYGVCEGLGKIIGGHGFNLTLPLHYGNSFEGKLNENSVITLGSENGQTLYWNGPGQYKGYFGILLGVVGQCRKMKNGTYDEYGDCKRNYDLKTMHKDWTFIHGARNKKDKEYAVIGLTLLDKEKLRIAVQEKKFSFGKLKPQASRSTAKYIVAKN